MNIITLNDDTYADLLELKNHVTVKVIQNWSPEITTWLDNPKSSGSIYDVFDPKKFDYDPTHTMDAFLREIVGSIWIEQKTGRVNSIT